VPFTEKEVDGGVFDGMQNAPSYSTNFTNDKSTWVYDENNVRYLELKYV